MPTEVLIQNVSSQCIPNLVAAETFQPKRMIWVYTDESQNTLQQLQQSTQHITNQQEIWHVQARDSELMQQRLKACFAALSLQGKLVFHLTCGTKGMALQGLMQLAMYKQKHGADVSAVVMNPKTQQFDMLFPQAGNAIQACAQLRFKHILAVHGSERHKHSGRDMQRLKKYDAPLSALRNLHKPMMQAMQGRTVCSIDESADKGFYLRGGHDLPKVVQQGLALAQDCGAIQHLHMTNTHFSFQSQACDNPIAYIRNTWMEDWVGAVLAKHDDGQWHGGYSSVKVSIKTADDYQEFDFLGARKNHLVYWSCKNMNEVKTPQLFEIDALRDEVGGRDFHVAGLLHTAVIKQGLHIKAKRLGLKTLQVTVPDAEERLLAMSCL
ncbi:MAG: hypothetical protein COB41_09865 [Proteobacteria bacterium]|nr:MAG: hypothetical protein COB41_09865 [Pseudomonadota bacterium]